MKEKTIKKVLQRKFEDWVASIEDEPLRKRVKQNTVITGGAIASMLLRESVNDFDIYFRNKETAAAVALYYLEKYRKLNSHRSIPDLKLVDADGTEITEVESEVLSKATRLKIRVKSQGVTEETEDDQLADDELPEGVGLVDPPAPATEKPPYRPVFISTNAITLANKVQLVFRFFGEPDEIHENYDFVHCTNYWTSWDHQLVLRQPALVALLTKELKYVGSRYPLCSMIRVRKFVQRGWTINAGQILKMAMQLNGLDLNKLDVLEDQLVGVDSIYFERVISALQEKGQTEIDMAYLTEVIDRIF